MANPLTTNRWPKILPELTQEQEQIRNDFMKQWLEVLPQRFGIIEKFNHRYPLRTHVVGEKTLEIGAGLGAHLQYESLSEQEYTAIELRENIAEKLRALYPQVHVLVGDCQEHIDVPDNYFNRVLAIHVLEHLPDLPEALDEIKRVLHPEGRFSVVIPCEGGLAYTLGRNVSARPLFEKRYKQSYDWFIASEHINLPHEIIEELQTRFTIVHKTFFPLGLPIITTNLVIGLTLTHHK